MSTTDPNMVAAAEQALKTVLAQYGNGPVVPSPVAPPSWAPPQQPGGLPPISGVAVPIKVMTPMGSLRIYLSLGAEVAQSQQSLMSAVQALQAAGFPLDIYQGGNGGWNNGGGWRGNGGYGSGWRGGNGGGRW